MRRKINWHRGIMKTISMLFLVLIFILSIGTIVDPANANKEEQIIEIIVSKNESLWSIAEKYDDNKIDLRKYIYQIKELNQINDTIYPGQVLYIPVP